LRLPFAPAALFSVALALSGCGGSHGATSGGPASGAGSGSSTGSSSPPPLFITGTKSIPPIQVSTPFSVQLTTQNGTAPFTWKATSLPQGVVLDSTTGILSGSVGTPACPLTVGVTVTDASTPSQMASATLALTVEGLVSSPNQGQVGAYYDSGISLECGQEPVAWTLVSGSLPPGVQMLPFPGADSQLNFQGTATQSGTYNFVVRAKDPIFQFQANDSIIIIPAALNLTDDLMQIGVVGRAFDHTVAVSGGTPPYTFAVTSGSLPPGLQLNPTTGEITGTPQAAGLTQFTITLADASGLNQFRLIKPDNILVTAAPLPSRNDTVATATPIAPGTLYASISPYTDSSGNAAPDQDYYVLSGLHAGETYQVGVSNGYESWNGTYSAPTFSSIDPAIELVDANGTRLATCNDPVADSPPSGASYAAGAKNFTDPCITHSPLGATSPYLTFQTSSSNQAFYIHVFDFDGRARPDFTYTLVVTKQ
jgi:hypothetical protein